MKVTDFDFHLPEELIAKRPLRKRDSSRLLVLHRDGLIEHKRFFDLPDYLSQGDMLLINNTKVFPARLIGRKKTGGILDILLVKDKGDNVWDVLSKGKYSGIIKISEELKLEIHEGRTARFICSGNLMDSIWKYGSMPLPPYIRRPPDESDKKTYQTVYAKEEGSIAAPTAGLHFTEELLKTLNSKGVLIREVTLHVGIGTFKPIRTANVEQHVMDSEFFEIEKTLISEIENVRSSGRRIFAVGTTTTRAIEGYLSGKWSVTRGNGSKGQGVKKAHTCKNNGVIYGFTDLFIYPGYKFKVVDSLITNFHLPRSTPLMLVAALCGMEKLKRSYEEAIASKYRFFSYGDAMLIL
ncbi:MAG: tRNA preQ1(34) S-adenosylmethionine ribosyltransferase-isomerase QueA [Thermodesulfovibrionales bacterium]